MSKILVLGSSGFIGSELKKNIFFSSHDVVYSDIILNDSNTKFIDILDFEMLSKEVDKFEIIINLTGQISDPIDNCLKINTEGTFNIIKAIKSSKKKIRLIHLSSVVVYGNFKGPDENSITIPDTSYGLCKYFAENLIKEHLKDFTILRLSNLYGENCQKGIINYLKKSFLNSEKIYLNTDINLKRDFIYIEDFLKVLMFFLEKSTHKIYNVGSGYSFSVNDLISNIQKINKRQLKFNFTKGKTYNQIEYLDSSRLKKENLNIEFKNVFDFLKFN